MNESLIAALADIVGMINSPRYDDLLLAEAGVALDRALFPLLVRIDRLGPLSVVALAEHAGRDHSTVSRQIAKLEALGLAQRAERSGDQRMRPVLVTLEGRALARTLAAARQRLFERIFAGWTDAERAHLTLLARKLADGMKSVAEPKRN